LGVLLGCKNAYATTFVTRFDDNVVPFLESVKCFLVGCVEIVFKPFTATRKFLEHVENFLSELVYDGVALGALG
jgi:hypothetical protein